MASKSNLLLVYHRRFLLRSKLGRAWRASLSQFAIAKGLVLQPNSLSHIVAADWRSSGLHVEEFIASVLELPFEQVWPEHQRARRATG
jgi:lambda repressor-like predicted transcriptional regulator